MGYIYWLGEQSVNILKSVVYKVAWQSCHVRGTSGWHRDSSYWFDFDHVILQLLSRNMQRPAAATATNGSSPPYSAAAPIPTSIFLHRFLLLGLTTMPLTKRLFCRIPCQEENWILFINLNIFFILFISIIWLFICKIFRFWNEFYF